MRQLFREVPPPSEAAALSTVLPRLLYRGMNVELYDKLMKEFGTALTPKEPGSFTYTFLFDATVPFDGSWTFGDSANNAVLRHQLDAEGFRTAGISTSRRWERARHYALEGDTYERGYVFTIKPARLDVLRVRAFMVAEWVEHPFLSFQRMTRSSLLRPTADRYRTVS